MRPTPGAAAAAVGFAEAAEASEQVAWAEASEGVALAFVEPGSAADASPVSDVLALGHGVAVVPARVCVPAGAAAHGAAVAPDGAVVAGQTVRDGVVAGLVIAPVGAAAGVAIQAGVGEQQRRDLALPAQPLGAAA